MQFLPFNICFLLSWLFAVLVHVKRNYTLKDWIMKVVQKGIKWVFKGGKMVWIEVDKCVATSAWGFALGLKNHGKN